MHGYDLPPPSMGPAPGGPHSGTILGPAGGGPGGQPPSDAMTHPDSTDSYVTYVETLESDESLPASP